MEFHSKESLPVTQTQVFPEINAEKAEELDLRIESETHGVNVSFKTLMEE